MGERSIISIAKLGVICWTWLELAYDGLERGFKFFNGLEGAVCAMCAPEDQRKSRNSQREQAENERAAVSAVADVSRGGEVSFGRPRICGQMLGTQFAK
jgi:hypothetical protein